MSVRTRQYLVQVDSQQKVEDAVHDQHEQGHVKRMRAIGQGGKHSTISLGLQVNHLTYVYIHMHTITDQFPMAMVINLIFRQLYDS